MTSIAVDPSLYAGLSKEEKRQVLDQFKQNTYNVVVNDDDDVVEVAKKINAAMDKRDNFYKSTEKSRETTVEVKTTRWVNLSVETKQIFIELARNRFLTQMDLWEQLLIADDFASNDPRRYIVTLGYNVNTGYNQFPPRIIRSDDIIKTTDNPQDAKTYYSSDVYGLLGHCIWYMEQNLSGLDKLWEDALFTRDPRCSGLLTIRQGRRVASETGKKVGEKIVEGGQKIGESIQSNLPSIFGAGSLVVIGLIAVAVIRVAGNF